MLIATTPTIANHEITETLGLVSAEVIVGANIVKDFFASITDIFGGRSGSYETALIDGKKAALAELIQKAKKLEADAIVSVDMDFEAVGQGSMFMINISGTAVKLK